MGRDERRRSIRLKTRLTAVVKNASSDATQQALTKDISGNGVCIITDALLDIGTPLSIEMQLPDHDKPVSFLGDVIWSVLTVAPGGVSKNAPAETGVRFVSIDPKVRTAIVQYARLNALPPP